MDEARREARAREWGSGEGEGEGEEDARGGRERSSAPELVRLITCHESASEQLRSCLTEVQSRARLSASEAGVETR